MLVLGLDPSLTNFGWALYDSEGTQPCLERGRFRTKPRQFEDEIARYLHLRSELSALLARMPTRKVGIEHPIFGDSYSEGMYALFMFCLEALKAAQCDVIFFAPPQVKSLAREILGRPTSWKMDKSSMVDAAKKDTGGGTWDHNEADAYLIARYASRFWTLHNDEQTASTLTSGEKRIFLEIRQVSRGVHKGQVQLKGILHRENERFFLWSKTAGDSSWQRQQAKRRQSRPRVSPSSVGSEKS